jgi:hypothetical protein
MYNIFIYLICDGFFFQIQKVVKDILDAFARLEKVTVSFVMYVCLSVCLSAWNNSALTVSILVKFYTWTFFENLSRKFKFYKKNIKSNGYFT